MSKDRLRVLLIAQIANPEWISVPLVGWSQTRAIANIADAHIITELPNREVFQRAGCVEGEYFTIIDTEPVRQPIEKLISLLRGGEGKGWTTAMAFSVFPYYYFERQVWRKFGKRIANQEFDIVHRVTPLSPTIPSILGGKCRQVGVPFIVGPLNGGLPWPKAFDTVRRQEKEWLSYVRDVYKLFPGYRSTRRDAAAILVGSRNTWEQMPEQYRAKSVYIPENAIDPQRYSLRSGVPQTPVKVAFVGRLVPYKGADMLLEAAAPLIRDRLLTVEIIGDGPDMPRLQSLIAEEQLADGVKLAGWLEHAQVQERLAQADIFGFPSIREFGGAVVIEAMAMGVVPIVVDYGGPGEFVTPDTGYTVPIAPRTEIVRRFREILTDLANNPSAIAPLGQRARDRALNLFTWDKKAQQTLEVYKWVLGQRPDKPDFGMPFF
ncbi:glycosyltransferase family 4 protein [Desertifilum sp. FACHB-1129]|uniref:Glycosyl transferase family 1 n=2 Tax=Desertifilum tharense IPPAS B-1220 TaxID=1781255 RepID=A0A1E5QP51_9CYAN|nr:MULTISPECIES: glycosyltransferase family 4 protein [Desertifilum]MDA0210670.1 glycosyltransferase family 4 protein [Cyanobacteria bacterium FC1]MBD2312919.1 glycosyltransferase family 4 protein [Desertifilum sp. FACHB-1129]MBD2323796.1 glycosyltransferase family 4 protein [Desertifilum sp. FACHB-866]MBD2333641.1 glycosyltransferase family 4 protein [Desertifilum sp. FACHB-868]OEJ76428.1 glycosyl transferase family 1 [Desertifilum tharense IPPAS B-1220]